MSDSSTATSVRLSSDPVAMTQAGSTVRLPQRLGGSCRLASRTSAVSPSVVAGRFTRSSDTPGVVATVRTAARTRLWPWAIALFVASLVAVLTSARGDLVGDNPSRLHWAPDRLLSDSTSIWESNQGLGRFRLDFWPAPTVFFTVVRGIGLSAALAGNLWHALLLTIAGVGMIAVVRLF